ncbi:MAG: helix-turn-helix domain-containing protein [Clostridia bacterium]|nr:helix-turn-helix domain-containing protein [Clostridia bacterium]
MIYENIQILRKKRSLTQEALAEEVGVTRQTIAKWESGESIPDLELAGRLAAALDVSLDDLTHAPREELEEESLQGKHMFGVVTVGDKGQIVIPVRARRIFGIKPGDQLMVLGEDGKGLALTDARLFMSVAEAYRNGK